MKAWSFALMGLFLTNAQPGLALLNLALKQTTTSTDYRRETNIEYGPSSLVVDGNDSDQMIYNFTTRQCLYTIDRQTEAFWQVDLAQDVVLDHVEIIFWRGINIAGHKRRRNGYSIIVSETPAYLPRTRDNTCYRNTDFSSGFRDKRSCSNIGRYVTIYNERKTPRSSEFSRFAILELCEVKVMGCPINTQRIHCRENCPTTCVDFLCFPGNGTCMRGCRPGYQGHECQDASIVAPGDMSTPIGTIVAVITGTLLAVMIVGVVVFMAIKKRRRRVPITNREMGVLYDNIATGMHADTEQSHMYERLGNTVRREEIQNDEANSYEIVL
ncbi:uncharacterized protein [Argopecten irradians]|uniref:uncharacterized protein isoform X2 n=1 Tax=Argopecten irradians TaxID=31199 RepID=UPI0037150204